MRCESQADPVAAVSWSYAVHRCSPLYHTAGGLDTRAANQWGHLPVIVVLIRHRSCREQMHEAKGSEDLAQRTACLCHPVRAGIKGMEHSAWLFFFFFKIFKIHFNYV